jgi:hypothetical protein
MAQPKASDSKKNYLARIRAGVSQINDLSQAPEWIERNTAHPDDNNRRWTFLHHEYQVGILRDTTKVIDVQKCSQVGMSELSIRAALAILSIQRNFTCIYVLPTAGFASSFVKGRFNPVIEASRYLKAAVNRDVDSTEMKQIGTSFLYIKGTIGKSANISVPAQGLFKDEVDFCDQDALKGFNSRLGHAMEREIQRGFSTPTVANYGINAAFSAGSQAHYCVKCRACHQWVAPNFMTDVEIPGFDGTVATFEKEDLENHEVRIDSAFIRCPNCTNPLHWKDLCNPEKRQWIHKYPDRDRHSYQVCPYDVPMVNPLAKTIGTLTDYGSKKDWVNFKLGYPFEDAQTSFLDVMVHANRIPRTIQIPEMDSASEKNPHKICSNTFVGIDIGKTSWFVCLQEDRNIAGKLNEIYKERIRQDGEDYLYRRVKYLEKVLGAVNGVMDAGPDISTSKKYSTNGVIGATWACYYVRKGKDTLDIITTDPDEGIVKAARTETFNDLAAEVNAGRIGFSDDMDYPLMRQHLASMKRVDGKDSGELISKWVNTGDDHYAHALNYARIAYLIAKSATLEDQVLPVMPMMSGVKMRSKEVDNRKTFGQLFIPNGMK